MSGRLAGRGLFRRHRDERNHIFQNPNGSRQTEERECDGEEGQKEQGWNRVRVTVENQSNESRRRSEAQCPYGVAENAPQHAELLAFNENLDRERNVYRKDARKYAKKVKMIASQFVVPSDDHELTLKAIKTIVELGGEA